jgi:ABC-type transporter Mla maintaining outer membrane lipid asymmetry ATPase subunit MlaF
LPHVLSYTREVEHEMQHWNCNRDVLAACADDAVCHMNAEQLEIYHAVTSAIDKGRQVLAFVDGKGGCGKTFLLRAICDRIRSAGRLFLPGATSAFAVQNYDGGRTIHSAFKVCALTGCLWLSLFLMVSINYFIDSCQRPEQDAHLAHSAKSPTGSIHS